ncbi:class I SAM-dependent methyltransferase [Patescibacteria group bacterium]|nr:class I SAM-dependent methyltransferase [Patescibacteria group bacterium]MBU1931559.1 class I SAM-dependent methyltransferase [Patescibacteria group bacterium]
MVLIKQCPVCTNKKTKDGLTGYNKCVSCLSLYATSMPSAKKITERINYWGKKFVGNPKNEPILQSNYERAGFLSKYTKKGKRKLIDVGCGNGNFLRCAKQANYDISGMDISSPIVEYLQALNVPLYNSLKSIKDKYFDIVTCFDVIEHTTNPRPFLTSIKRILKKDGLFMITTPNGAGVSATILKNRWWVLGPSDHYVLFNPRSLPMLLEKVGFTIINIQTDTLTQWFQSSCPIFNKVANKLVYLGFLPFKKHLFNKGLGDNIQVLTRLKA